MLFGFETNRRVPLMKRDFDGENLFEGGGRDRHL